MNVNQFKDALLKENIRLSEEQLKQFETYYHLLITWNQKVNLTALTERHEVYLKHFYDSLTPAFHLNLHDVHVLADVGAGAGFPSLPLKICYPHLKVTIIDSLKKRILFLKELVDNLGLTDISLYHARAEEMGQAGEHREQYDLVLARAVARLPVLAEFCLPLVKQGGLFVALKGSQGVEEAKEGKTALKQLGGKLVDIVQFQLPDEAGERQLLIIDKVKRTPERYPRQPGLPAKKPIR